MTLAPNNAMGTVFDDEGFDFRWTGTRPAPEVIADEDFYSREPILARRHLERMPKERRAQLEREWL